MEQINDPSLGQTEFEAHAVQVQTPEELTPFMTSQYDPSGREVVKVVLHAESSLLMTTNPADPTVFVNITVTNNRQQEGACLVQMQFGGIEETPSWSFSQSRHYYGNLSCLI